MHHHRFTALVHRPPHSTDRRQVLGQLLGCLAAVGLLPRPIETAARKRRKKRRKKRHHTSPEPSACARTCGSVCNFCVTRVQASLVCGDGMLVACNRPCSSGTDCLGTGFSDCISTIEEVATGHVTSACETPGGFCANISACAV
jgi:hypothetical protein